MPQRVVHNMKNSVQLNAKKIKTNFRHPPIKPIISIRINKKANLFSVVKQKRNANNPIQSLLNQKPSIPNIKTVAPAFSFRFHPNKYSNPNNDAVIPKKKITAHRISIIRQQIKSLESLTVTAPEEKFLLLPFSKDWFFFILLAQFFFSLSLVGTYHHLQ